MYNLHIHEWKLCHAVTSRRDAAWHRGSTYVAQFSTNQENLAEQKVQGNVLTNAVLGGKCRIARKKKSTRKVSKDVGKVDLEAH